jgi:hypothetical protein
VPRLRYVIVCTSAGGDMVLWTTVACFPLRGKEDRGCSLGGLIRSYSGCWRGGYCRAGCGKLLGSPFIARRCFRLSYMEEALSVSVGDGRGI